jgi:hypothetical protein
MGISQDTDRLARAMFRLQQIPDVLRVLGWYDSEPPDTRPVPRQVTQGYRQRSPMRSKPTHIADSVRFP